MRSCAQPAFLVVSQVIAGSRARIAHEFAPQGNELTRKQIDDYTDYVGRFGAKGLAYIKVNDVDAGRDGLQSPILKFLPDEVIAMFNDVGISRNMGWDADQEVPLDFAYISGPMDNVGNAGSRFVARGGSWHPSVALEQQILRVALDEIPCKRL